MVPRMMEPKCWKIEVTLVEEPMRFDPNNNDAFIIEDTIEDTRKEDKVKRNPAKKKTPQQLVISTIVDPIALLGQILQSPVQLPVRDIVGSSKELANLLTKNLQPVTSSEIEEKSLMARQDQQEDLENKRKKKPFENEAMYNQSH